MPTYDIACESCGRDWERWSCIAERDAPCEVCGGPVTRLYRHSVQSDAFAAYYDEGLGTYVTSLGDRHALMRANKLDYRDKMSKGALSARLDRIHEQKKEHR